MPDEPSPNGNPPGRPSDYEEKHKDVLNWISKGMSIKDACALSDVGRTTYHDWQKKFPQFSKELKRALAQCKAQRVMRILLAAKKSWTASAWWLERMYPDEYALKRLLEFQDDREDDPAYQLIKNAAERAALKSGIDPAEIEAIKEGGDEKEKDIPRFL